MESISASISHLETESILSRLEGSLGRLLEWLERSVARAKLNRWSGKEGAAGLVLLLLGGHLYFRRKYSYWSRRKLKGPKPLPIVGNQLSFVFRPKVDLQREWAAKYGRLFGMYLGRQPVLVCADASVLKRICIKDFDKFPNRLFVGIPNKYQEHFLVAIKDDHWRSVRSLISPTFSSGKMKVVFQLLRPLTDELIEQHKALVESGEPAVVDTKLVYYSFSLKASMKSFFGVELNRSDQGDEFERIVKNTVNFQLYRFLVHSVMPKFLLNWIKYPLFGEKQMEPLAEHAKRIIEHRRENPSNRFTDYLQLLIDANSDRSLELAESNVHEEHHAMGVHLAGRFSKQRLTDEEAYCQAMSFMFVATETTSSSIAHTIYLLAHNPEVQERLYGELAAISVGGQFEYDALASCSYLDCVISESLRLMSPAIALDRIASEDYRLEEYELPLEAGTPVVLAYAAIMRDPEYWPQPDTFDPERFAPENKSKIVPGSYCPFGIGPRACIGFRFALTEAKQALAKLLTNFKFERVPGLEYPPRADTNTFILNVLKDLKVVVKKRH